MTTLTLGPDVEPDRWRRGWPPGQPD